MEFEFSFGCSVYVVNIAPRGGEGVLSSWNLLNCKKICEGFM